MRWWILLFVLPGNTVKKEESLYWNAPRASKSLRVWEWKVINLTGSSLSLFFLHFCYSLVPLSLLFVAAKCVFRCVWCPCLSLECIHVSCNRAPPVHEHMGEPEEKENSAYFGSELPVNRVKERQRKWELGAVYVSVSHIGHLFIVFSLSVFQYNTDF